MSVTYPLSDQLLNLLSPKKCSSEKNTKTPPRLCPLFCQTFIVLISPQSWKPANHTSRSPQKNLNTMVTPSRPSLRIIRTVSFSPIYIETLKYSKKHFDQSTIHLSQSKTRWSQNLMIHKSIKRKLWYRKTSLYHCKITPHQINMNSN